MRTVISFAFFVTCTVPTAFVDSVFGSGTGPVVYSDVQCVGHETDIMNCPKKVYPDITCTAGNAAGVMCADGKFALRAECNYIIH